MSLWTILLLAGLAALVLVGILGTLSTLSGSMKFQFNYNVGVNGPSSSISFPQTSNNNTITASTTYLLGGNVLSGINEVAVVIQAVAASGTATINLNALTDVVGLAAVLVRLKSYLFWLLTAADDATNGTSCSSVTVGAAVSNPCTLGMGGTSPTFTLNGGSAGTGDKWGYCTGQAGGITVSGTVKNVLITNNDSVNAAAVLCAFGGATT